MKHLKKVMFGERVKGEPLSSPSFKLTVPKNQPSLDEWVKLVKFGSRYGHRGSFYTNK